MNGRESAGRRYGEIRCVGYRVICFWFGVNMEHQVFDTDSVFVCQNFVANRLEDINSRFSVI